MMPAYETAVYGIAGIERWYDPSSRSSIHIPMIGVNDSSSAASGGTFNWPAGSMMVHPFQNEDAVLAWKSPITGLVSVSGGFRSIDHGGGSGITWYIDMGTVNLASGAYAAGGSQNFSQGSGIPALGDIPVTPGTFLYFVVGCAANSNCDYDSTSIDLTIQQFLPSANGPSANVPDAPFTPLLLISGMALAAGVGLRRLRG